MKKLDTSTILRFLDAVGTNGAQFRHRGRTTTFMLFNNFRSLRTLVGGTEFELVPMSARLVFNKKVRSINAALLADVVGVYMAFSCRIDADALIGRHLALSMPGFELTGKLRASRFDGAMAALTGRRYYQFMLSSLVIDNECGTCNRRTGGRRCVEGC
jgi:hypothetical protein